MSWKEEKEEFAKEILGLLYEHRLIRTFYRTNRMDGPRVRSIQPSVHPIEAACLVPAGV